MKEYIQRMRVELKELLKKIEKGKAALVVPPYGADDKGQTLLSKQIGFMQCYAEVLEERIKHEEAKS